MPGKAPPSPRRRAAALLVVAVLGGASLAIGIGAKRSLHTPDQEPPSPLAAPNCGDAQTLAGTGGEPVSIRIQAEDATLPDELQHGIAAGTRLAFVKWRQWLGEDALQKPPITLRFLGDPQRFRQIYGKPNGEAWTTTGFYRTRTNEVLILYTPAYHASALANALHEISHLLTTWHLGATPPWFNEGLAEYYETLKTTAPDPRFSSNLNHLQLLRREGPVPVDEITRLSRQEWMREDAERRYASAWSLTAFLMESADGRPALERVVHAAHTQRCEARADLRPALASYPGGFRSLEEDWRAWLEDRYAALPDTQRGSVTTAL